MPPPDRAVAEAIAQPIERQSKALPPDMLYLFLRWFFFEKRQLFLHDPQGLRTDTYAPESNPALKGTNEELLQARIDISLPVSAGIESLILGNLNAIAVPQGERKTLTSLQLSPEPLAQPFQ